ncbi:MAG: hypothetical protein ACI86X_002279 [Moritella sp.]|jgi:uncharacterized protein (DUF2249 family)
MSQLKQININVSYLEAPEPMRQILMALGQLKQGQYLTVNHRKDPVPLYQKLDEMGFVYFIQCAINKKVNSTNAEFSSEAEFLITIAFKSDAKAIQALLGLENG